MCEGHHGSGSASHCCCGGGHAQHGRDCGGYSRQGCGCGCEHPPECHCGCHHGLGSASGCCCGEDHARHTCGCGSHSRHGSCDEHPPRFHRRFRSREDDVAGLEQYLKDLEGEAKGVRERLAELRTT